MITHMSQKNNIKLYPDRVNHAIYEKAVGELNWSVGMTSLNEQKYLQWFARDLYEGKGMIVELGCWLGSLTQALCRGLESNSSISEKCGRIQVFDLFKWEHNMEDTCKAFNLPCSGRYLDGDDYKALYEEVMQAHLPLLSVTRADLSSAMCRLGAIELLIVDAMKYEALCDNISRQFYPSLIEGKSYLIHQDFMHFYESWVHISAYRLRDYIAPVYEVLDAGSFVFKCLRAPPGNLLGFEKSIAEVEDSEIDAAYDWAIGLLDPRTRNVLAAAHTMAYVHKKDFSRAIDLYAAYRKEYPAETSLTPSYYQFDHMREYCVRFGFIADWPDLPSL
jgi:hypothetical protein